MQCGQRERRVTSGVDVQGKRAGSRSASAVKEHREIRNIHGTECMPQQETDKLLTLTDSTVSVQALLNLSRDTSPRSGIKKELKDLLHKRAHQETAIGWVRSHIGISGNEKADRRAAYKLGLGRIAGSQQAATGVGIRIAAKARQKGTQTEPGFGVNRSTLWPAPTATTAPRTATMPPLTAPAAASSARSSLGMPGRGRTWTQQFGERGREKKRSGTRWRCTLPTSTSR
ncbi:hypothetical protein EV426DRAFT_645394 [Tirmania nivea]|nr:hypothetical protein EV426DRAFT_645394 [Tirmania nivea]